MTQIVELKGTEKRLYQLVAPLVMNPEVLKQNYNYPFRTSESFVWFVAVDGKDVVGFLPLEYRKREVVINNYYIKENNAKVLKTLLEKVIASIDEDKQLSSVTFIEHQTIFQELGFSVEKTWRRYVKMNKEK
ncbi:hypothetical protein [Bacteroides oleiciplenus]|uniref:N-acetyltransferase domain-containing protein n=1 Tax=Bacteroides oleiciplenus TaxID=626931 RepID=A0A3E5B522_9BACE|nr:hypothetical protein [Bacteroides oleiciplenus]RGN32643.1 hypothetical protein DXB65_17925 [Bacteroides oleiciplenus]